MTKPRAPKARAKPHSRTKTAARARVAAAVVDPDKEWADEIVAKVVAACHPKQRAFVLDPGRRVTALCARGAGKTTAGIGRFLIRMVRTPKAKCVYIALTKEDAEELIWEKLKDFVERLGIEASFTESKLKCVLSRNGSQLRLVGADTMKDVDKLRGKPHHEVGVDEAAAMKPALLKSLIQRAIGPRLGDFGGSLWMISTPGSILDGLFFEATSPAGAVAGKHRRWEDRAKPEFANWTRWSSHAWSLLDGAKFVAAIARLWDEALVEKDAEKWTDANPIWRREYLGEWAADDTEVVFKYRAHTELGAPWNQWEPERTGTMRIAVLPDRPDWLYAFGLDMGHSDAFALQVLAASPSDPTRRIYQVYEFERTKMYIREIAKLLIGEDLDADKPTGLIGAFGWPAGMVADVTGLGGTILGELQEVYGIAIVAAEQKAKFAAIVMLNGDLLDGRFLVMKESNLEKQMLALQWVANEHGQLSEHKGMPNHSTDAAIYARRLLSALFAAEAPPAAPKDPRAPPQAPEAPKPTPDILSDEIDDSVFDSGFDGSWGNG